MTDTPDKMVIAVDIGGTKISSGLIKNKQLIRSAEIPTGAMESTEMVLANLFTVINEVLVENVVGIGIGVPGIVDSNTGIIYDLANIKSWSGIPLKKLVEEKIGIPTYIENDANCFALGVKYFSNSEHIKNIVALTLGTGLGVGLILNDKLYTGLKNGAGELAWISYLDANYEQYCSSKFFDEIKMVNGLELYNHAVNDNHEAKQIWSEFGRHIGQLLNLIIYSYSPELIVLGGSVSQGFKFFIESAKNQLNQNRFQRIVSELYIQRSEQHDIALLGASRLCY